MLLSTLDLALRAGTAAVLLLLAALLYRDFRGAVSGRLAVAFALGSAAHAVSSAAGFATPVTPGRTLLLALSTGNVVVFWLFARALFDDRFEPRWWHAPPWAAVVGISFLDCLLIGPAPAPDFRIFGVGINAIVMSLIALGFIALAVGQAIASWSIDLVESRRRLRILIVGAAAIYGGMPRDAFYASGVLGQYVIIVPSRRLVIARFGVSGNQYDIAGVSKLVADVIVALGE
jgi:hypothetical protein